jgi:hypothetical protein
MSRKKNGRKKRKKERKKIDETPIRREKEQ